MNKNKGIVGLVFGVFGILILPIPLGLLAIFFGYKSMKGGSPKTGWLGILLGILVLIILFTGSNPIITEYQNGMSHVEAYKYNNCNDNCWYSLNNFDEWWNEEGSWEEGGVSGGVRHIELRSARYQNSFGITKEKFKSFSMPNGIEKGDILIRTRVSFNELKVGDVIIYKYYTGQLVTGRIVKIFSKDGVNYIDELSDTSFETNYLQSKSISEEQIRYEVSARISKIGLPNVWVKELLRNIMPLPFD